MSQWPREESALARDVAGIGDLFGGAFDAVDDASIPTGESAHSIDRPELASVQYYSTWPEAKDRQCPHGVWLAVRQTGLADRPLPATYWPFSATHLPLPATHCCLCHGAATVYRPGVQPFYATENPPIDGETRTDCRICLTPVFHAVPQASLDAGYPPNRGDASSAPSLCSTTLYRASWPVPDTIIDNSLYAIDSSDGEMYNHDLTANSVNESSHRNATMVESTANRSSRDNATITQDTEIFSSALNSDVRSQKPVQEVFDPQRRVAVCHDAGDDAASTLSSLANVTPQEKYKLRMYFAKAMMDHIGNAHVAFSDESTSIKLHTRCQGLVKDFADAVQRSSTEEKWRDAAKALRKSRLEISQEFESRCAVAPAQEVRVRPSIVVEADSRPSGEDANDKVQNWLGKEPATLELDPSVQRSFEHALVSRAAPAKQLAADSDSSSSDGDRDVPLHIAEQDIYEYFVGHDAFKTLIANTKELVSRHYTNMMAYVEHKVQCAVARFDKEAIAMSRIYAMLKFDLNIRDYLDNNYSRRNRPDVGSILAVTGSAEKAQMLPMSAYFAVTWPKYSKDLLHAITMALGNVPDPSYSVVRTHGYLPSNLTVDLAAQTVAITGPQDFIVSIAQQLSWICAALRGSSGTLSTAHTSFEEAETSPRMLRFCIETNIVPVEDFERRSCWCAFLPNTVLAAGFPIRPRPRKERGLEIPVEILAALGGIRLASRFCGGIILKGKGIAFVPIERIGTSVYWHFVEGEQGKLEYEHIDRLYPRRLKINSLAESELYTTRAFLDWCGEYVETPATLQYDYEGVRPATNVNMLPERDFDITGGSFGFSKILTGTVNFTVSPNKDGHYNAKRPGFYKTLLRRASERCVVMMDTEANRAHCVDSERYILHVIRHRVATSFYGPNRHPQIHHELSKVVKSHTSQKHGGTKRTRSSRNATNNLQQPDFTLSSKGLTVRELMTELESTPLEASTSLRSTEVVTRVFRDEVEELDEAIDLQIATLREKSRKSRNFISSHGETLCGYTWSDVAKDISHASVFSFKLPRECGKWPKILRQENALVVFASSLRDMVLPKSNEFTCKAFPRVPTGLGYLSIDFTRLSSMIRRQGIPWNPNPDVFCDCKPTYAMVARGTGYCTCDRVQDLSPPSFKKQPHHNTEEFPSNGIVIVGRRGIHRSQAAAGASLGSRNRGFGTYHGLDQQVSATGTSASSFIAGKNSETEEPQPSNLTNDDASSDDDSIWSEDADSHGDSDVQTTRLHGGSNSQSSDFGQHSVLSLRPAASSRTSQQSGFGYGGSKAMSMSYDQETSSFSPKPAASCLDKQSPSPLSVSGRAIPSLANDRSRSQVAAAACIMNEGAINQQPQGNPGFAKPAAHTARTPQRHTSQFSSPQMRQQSHTTITNRQILTDLAEDPQWPKRAKAVECTGELTGSSVSRVDGSTSQRGLRRKKKKVFRV